MPKLKTALDVAQNRKATSFGHNSIVGTDRRRPVQTRPSSEGFLLPARKRDIASATARDDVRNMSILAWMVRRHLDNVSRFTPFFHIDSEKDSPQIDRVNSIVEKLLKWHASARHFDTLGKHGRDEWMRMFEATKVISGDCGGVKVKGGTLQGIEGERIKRVSVDGRTLGLDVQKQITESGILFNDDGTRKAFMVCKRTEDGGGLAFERLVPAANMIFDGYYPNRFDSDRGVSPLLTALNEGADVRETWEWLVLKAKASAIFGLAFTRKTSDQMGLGSDLSTAAETEPQAYSAQVAAGIKARGLINLDLDEGDDVKEIQSSTPNPTVIPFTRELIRSVLLSLDIPFTFYDSLTASFSARIADRNEYEESCEWKRDKNISILDEVYGDWLFPMWEAKNFMGFGDAVRAAGLTIEEVAASLTWVPAGRAWLDRAGEMSGHILAIAAGIESIPEVCAMYGKNAFKVAKEQARYLKNAEAPLLYAQGGQVAVQAIMAGMASGTQPSATKDAQNAAPVAKEQSNGE